MVQVLEISALRFGSFYAHLLLALISSAVCPERPGAARVRKNRPENPLWVGQFVFDRKRDVSFFVRFRQDLASAGRRFLPRVSCRTKIVFIAQADDVFPRPNRTPPLCRLRSCHTRHSTRPRRAFSPSLDGFPRRRLSEIQSSQLTGLGIAGRTTGVRSCPYTLLVSARVRESRWSDAVHTPPCFPTRFAVAYERRHCVHSARVYAS